MKVDLNGLLEYLKKDKRSVIPVPKENIIAFIEFMIELPKKLEMQNKEEIEGLIKEIESIKARHENI